MLGTEKLVAPKAERKPHAITAHGHSRADEYYWLQLSEAQRQAAVPDARTQEVIQHLEAENSYCESVLEPVRVLRDELFVELRARIKEDDNSVPYRENGYWYHHRYEEGKEYPIHVRRKDEVGLDGADFLNENEMAEGKPYFDLGDFEVSPNNALVAYSLDTVGRRQYELRFRDLTTGEELSDVIENTAGGAAWAATASTGTSWVPIPLRTWSYSRRRTAHSTATCTGAVANSISSSARKATRAANIGCCRWASRWANSPCSWLGKRSMSTP
jgi:oligopeptidase B